MIELERFKTKLIDEQKSLETELSGLARVNPDNPADWEMKPSGVGEAEFHDEIPEILEEEEEREATEVELEKRLRAVVRALNRIQDNAYGKCEVGGEEIEVERLDANPAARTCKAHIAEEDSLQ